MNVLSDGKYLQMWVILRQIKLRLNFIAVWIFFSRKYSAKHLKTVYYVWSTIFIANLYLKCHVSSFREGSPRFERLVLCPLSNPTNRGKVLFFRDKEKNFTFLRRKLCKDNRNRMRTSIIKALKSIIIWVAVSFMTLLKITNLY